MTMVSDIRSVCPLQALTKLTRTPLYVATNANMESEVGLVTDSSADITAIFSKTETGAFTTNMKKLFFDFVKHQNYFNGVRLIGENIDSVKNMSNCDFWQNSDPKLVPDFGKIF